MKDSGNTYMYLDSLFMFCCEMTSSDILCLINCCLLLQRKNGQINTLMKNHEKAFSDIKNYYNDITLNNLALINSLKVRRSHALVVLNT